MIFLDSLPAFVFFTGKGGVGKTSLACATAIRLADQQKRVLLVSTDPASNVGQVFGIHIGNHITAVTAVPHLSALEIDPQAAAQQYRDRIVEPARGVLDDTVVNAMEEQLSGACTTEIAAFDEFTALLTDTTITSQFDHIIFDTAPTGHTIRMLQLPGAWSSFLDEGKGDASCLGPLAGLGKQKEQYHAAVAALADPLKTRMILVARAQTTALREAARTHEELSAIGFRSQYLVINGVMPAAETMHDELALALYHREQLALQKMSAVLSTLPKDQLQLLGFDLVGLPALRALLGAVQMPEDGQQENKSNTHAGNAHITDFVDHLPQAPELESLINEIERDGHGLVMTMGKGGVGKTTIAAAVAVELARRGHPVHLTTSDPAAHVLAAIDGEIENLSVSRIDPQAATEAYRSQVMASKGKHLDTEARALLEEDLRSPCTEEIAVFQAFSRVIREAGKKFVVMDTAPTGHTLLLLDATGAYHREIARQMESTGMRFNTPMMQLQDPLQTKVLIVTLAETTPVLEAAGLQDDLRRAGIEPWAWVINNCLAYAHPHSQLLQQRAHHEVVQIQLVAEKYAQRWAVVGLQKAEPIGQEHLQMLMKLPISTN
ncbi:arsenical pump-driving ATPase [Undibacterium sp. LX40W]|uniref:Arsenical pump-driving ATPase n=1 Tax=Undibacterium nitidum TaxID=2762298 RepID=A0A923HVN8_9BURK|nr:arsenical pump-driving ATPase [Undibacterium nitidum]MBC3880961.1 arsenical pump-driving ATPase [Undibacterium nitidum]MBC3890306.1 arsenical pump-driving ATPase [Undibacterium sp. LX40W]